MITGCLRGSFACSVFLGRFLLGFGLGSFCLKELAVASTTVERSNKLDSLNSPATPSSNKTSVHE